MALAIIVFFESFSDSCSDVKEFCCASRLVRACDNTSAEPTNFNLTRFKVRSEASQFSSISRELSSKLSDLAIAFCKEIESCCMLSFCCCNVSDRSSSKALSSFSTFYRPSKLFSKASSGSDADKEPDASSNAGPNKNLDNRIPHTLSPGVVGADECVRGTRISALQDRLATI